MWDIAGATACLIGFLAFIGGVVTFAALTADGSDLDGFD